MLMDICAFKKKTKIDIKAVFKYETDHTVVGNTFQYYNGADPSPDNFNLYSSTLSISKSGFKTLSIQ